MIYPCLEVLLFWQYLDDHEFDIFGIGILFRDKKRQILFDYLCSEVVIYDVRYLFNGEIKWYVRGIWWNEYDKVLSFWDGIMGNFKTNFIGLERNTRILVVWSELV